MKNLILFLASVAVVVWFFDVPTQPQRKNAYTLIPTVTEWNSTAQKIVAEHREVRKTTGVTYYVSATGSDLNNGTTTGTAWQTIAKVNSFNFTAGDQVLFKRGDSFYGSIVVHDNNMTFDAYGISGAQPIITGFETASSFTASGSNKYEKAITADTTLNMVTINDVPCQIATGANPDSAKAGWKTYNSVASFNGSSTTKDTIRSMPDGMLGKHIIMKQNDWTILEVVITKQWHDTCRIAIWRSLNIGGSSGLDQSKNGYGWKPYRDTAYIDRLGEYVYENGKLHINLGSNPNAYTVKYSSVDTLFDNSTFDGTTVSNLTFTGGNKFGFWGSGCDGITIDNCNYDMMGAEGIAAYRMSNSVISNNNISNCMATGIYINSQTSPFSNIDVISNNLSKIGKMEGMGSWSMFGDYSAMNISAFSGLNALYNHIFDIGDCGIKWQGSQVEIAYNFVELFCQLLQDHGAYYNFWEYALCSGVTIAGNCNYYRDRWLHHNFACNGVGNINGTAGLTLRVNIFYSDGINGWTLYEYNYGWNFSRAGINMNMDSNIICRYNIFKPGDSSVFATARGFGIQQRQIPIRNLSITNNIVIMSSATQTTIAYYAGVTTASLPLNIAAIGLIDSNYVNCYLLTAWLGESATNPIRYTQAGFYAFSGFGLHDRLLPNYSSSQQQLVTNWSNAAVSKPLTGTWQDVYGTMYTDSIVLQPYTAAYITPGTPPVIEVPQFILSNIQAVSAP